MNLRVSEFSPSKTYYIAEPMKSRWDGRTLGINQVKPTSTSWAG